MRTLVYGMAMMACVCMQSCDDASKLAGSVAGTWTGAPENFYDDATNSATIVETYDFTRSDDTSTSTGGQVVITSLLASDGKLAVAGLTTPDYDISVSAKATASGSWTATGNNKIVITVNSKSIAVEVDPEAVTVSYENESGEAVPVLEHVNARLIRDIQTRFKQALQIRYLAPIKLDDVKVTGNTMTYTNDAISYTMQR